jgi:RpiB/LacA/LacB family sugar-phosphate isomerase
MRIAVSCDHAGYILKDTVIQAIVETGHEPLDLGPYTAERVDFPDSAELVGKAILDGKADRGILICGSGIGVCIAANKMKGIYASVCHDVYSAHQGVEHDNMNILCLGGQIIGVQVAKELVSAYLGAEFMDHGNYQRRFGKIQKIEEKGIGSS